jgi:hypothetical protein
VDARQENMAGTVIDLTVLSSDLPRFPRGGSKSAFRFMGRISGVSAATGPPRTGPGNGGSVVGQAAGRPAAAGSRDTSGAFLTSVGVSSAGVYKLAGLAPGTQGSPGAPRRYRSPVANPRRNPG